MGYRYRLHYDKLPGHPDLAFPGRRKIIWVHGCFWHRHPQCRLATTPKSNHMFWTEKFTTNQLRDRKNTALVKALGWKVLVVWQCQTANLASLQEKIKCFFESANRD